MSLNGLTSTDLTAAVPAGATPDTANAALAAQADPVVPALRLKRSGSRLEALRGSTELKFLQDAGEAVKDKALLKKK